MFDVDRCHGEKGNVVHEMATAHDPNIFSSTGAIFDTYYRSNGESLGPELSQKLTNLNSDITGGEKYHDEQKRYPGSRGNFIVEK